MVSVQKIAHTRLGACRSMSGLGDLDLHLLEGGGGLTDVETSSGLNTTCASTLDNVATANVVSSVISRGLKRAKSGGPMGASHQVWTAASVFVNVHGLGIWVRTSASRLGTILACPQQ